MERLAAEIQASEPKDVSGIARMIRDLSAELHGDLDRTLQLCQSLDPNKHLVHILHILSIVWREVKRARTWTPIHTYSSELLSSLHATQFSSISQAKDYLGTVAAAFAESLIANAAPACGIRPLRSALYQFQDATSPHTLTPVHVPLLKLCIAARHYRVASAMLDERDVVDINPTLLPSAVDVVQFYHLAGIVYCACKRFADAQQSLLIAWTVPTTTLSAVMVAAYKKYMLVSLLREERVPEMPDFTSSVFRKFYKPCVRPYTKIVDAFASSDPEKLTTAIAANEALLVQDGNLGLAKQVVRAHRERGVRRLTRTYVKLSLEQLAAKAGLRTVADATRQLAAMISEGDLDASINEPESTVSFQEAPTHHGGAGATHVLHHQLQQALSLMQKLGQLHQRVAGSREYVKQRLRGERRSQIEVAGETGFMGVGAGAGAGAGAGEGMLDEEAMLHAATIASMEEM